MIFNNSNIEAETEIENYVIIKLKGELSGDVNKALRAYVKSQKLGKGQKKLTERE